MAVVGASGSGKTTLLRAIVGFERPLSGRVILDSTDITNVRVAERGIAYVTQQPALQPNLTLADNVERPLKLGRKVEGDRDRRRRRVRRELRRFGLGGRGDKQAREAAAGEQHSADTARGTVRETGLILLDEPAMALDAQARRAAVRQLRLQQLANQSAMLVTTNDWAIAAALADRVAVLANGSIVQTAWPIELFDNPVSLHVAELTGQWPINRLAGVVRRTPGARTEIMTPAGSISTWREVTHEHVTVGIRPVDLEILDSASAEGGDGGEWADPVGGGELAGVVLSSAVLGGRSLVAVDADRLPLQAVGPVPPPPPGSAVRMAWRRAHLFTLEGDAIAHIE